MMEKEDMKMGGAELPTFIAGPMRGNYKVVDRPNQVTYDYGAISDQTKGEAAASTKPAGTRNP